MAVGTHRICPDKVFDCNNNLCSKTTKNYLRKSRANFIQICKFGEQVKL